MITEHLLHEHPCKPAHSRRVTFRKINQQSRIRLKKAIRARDHDALEAIILDIEHSIQIAAGNLIEILNGSALVSRSFGKYYYHLRQQLLHTFIPAAHHAWD